MTRLLVWRELLPGWVVISNGAKASAATTPFHTQESALFSAPICVNHLFTFKYPADPVDPVIRVLLSFPPFHELIVAPIYCRGTGFICAALPGLGLPAVILNPVRDDLRMMAPNAVAARAGGMKEKRDNQHYLLIRASIARGFSAVRQCFCA
ncbi:MAG: hypothetical protein BWX75_00302 [Candidatus Cloacimonetes bacterium ADurb.Bin088]|nr:MAG: hypothetical protein BWX75_00302 [Candidatus Cloacimonetes bacterium ADurb.Bin088]